jgi:hypothetical protein
MDSTPRPAATHATRTLRCSDCRWALGHRGRASATLPQDLEPSHGGGWVRYAGGADRSDTQRVLTRIESQGHRAGAGLGALVVDPAFECRSTDARLEREVQSTKVTWPVGAEVMTVWGTGDEGPSCAVLPVPACATLVAIAASPRTATAEV